jgi:hypothetical protein
LTVPSLLPMSGNPIRAVPQIYHLHVVSLIGVFIVEGHGKKARHTKSYQKLVAAIISSVPSEW